MHCARLAATFVDRCARAARDGIVEGELRFRVPLARGNRNVFRDDGGIALAPDVLVTTGKPPRDARQDATTRSRRCVAVASVEMGLAVITPTGRNITGLSARSRASRQTPAVAEGHRGGAPLCGAANTFDIRGDLER